MVFTTFAPEYSKDKVPFSKGDIFHFKNQEISFEQAHTLFANNFILSNPLIKETVCKRDIENLRDLVDINSGYMILDIDKIHSEEDAISVISFFRNNDYSINIFKSRSYGVDGKFHLKCIMRISTESSKTMLDAHINFLKSQLDDICEIDNSSTSRASYQAPCFRSEQLYFNDSGKTISENLLKDFIYTPPETFDFDFNQDTINWFKNNMIINHGVEFKARANHNGSYNVALPIEKKSKFSYFWFPEYPWIIQHPNKSKNINMMNEFIKTEEGKKYIKEKNTEVFRKYFDMSLIRGTKINQRFIEVSDEIKDILQSFSNKDISVLAVKGIMGGGKSNIIEEFNRTHNRTLFITMRRTLSYDMLSKYNSKHYLEHLGDTSDRYRYGDNLIVQVDSLHKINPEFFDYVVIDEFESLCIYTQSNMTQSKHYVKNMRVLHQLFNSQEKQFIVLDTFINSFSLNMYFSGKRVFLIENTYKDKTLVYSYTDRDAFISILEHKAKSKEKNEVITCSFGTLNELYAVESILRGLGLTTVSVKGDSTDEFKKLISERFRDFEVEYDVVLYSPTITVGVSNMNNVKHHFHYDEGKTIDPISSVQMLKRSRNAEYIHVYIKGDRYSQKSFDLNVLNDKVKRKFEKYHIDSDMMIFYNSDTNDVSEFGKFVNKFVAHKNFYMNNHRTTCLYMLGIQFDNILTVDDKVTHNRFNMTLKKIRSRKNKSVARYTGEHLDLLLLDELRESTNLSAENKVMLELLEIKNIFPILEDIWIYEIYNYSAQDKAYIDKIKFLYFYTLKIEEKQRLFEEYVLGNQREIISDENVLEILKFLIDAKLEDMYTKRETALLKNQHIYPKIGYIRKNGCLSLNLSVRNTVNELLHKGYVWRI